MKIGWIGTGVMGLPMACHLLDKYGSLSVYSRTSDKTKPLIEKGATLKSSPAEVGLDSDIVFTMVGYPKDVEDIYFLENGLIATARKDQIFVDMTTTSPSLARKIYKACLETGAASLDAPVSGGDVGALNQKLSIMVGGDKDIFSKIKPYFEVLGAQIVYQGEAGCGQNTKMTNQITIAGTMIGVCEALTYARASGLDARQVLQSIGGGAAGCWTLDNLAPRILDQNLDPGFYIEHFIKDMGIALEECRRMSISLPGLELVHSLYSRLKDDGYGKLGTQALVLALESEFYSKPSV